MTRKRIWEIGATVLLLAVVALALVAARGSHLYRQELNRQLESVLDTHDAERVTALLRQGADMHLRGEESHTTVLLVAALKGEVPLLNQALDGGVDVNAQDGEGNTALMHAAHSGRLEAVRKLLTAGATVNPRNGQGKTPLMSGAESGAAESVLLLLQHGAEVSTQDRKGRTALAYARLGMQARNPQLDFEQDHPTVIRLLRQRGAK